MTQETKLPRILTPKEIFTDKEYPTAIRFAEQQLHNIWFPLEINLEKDLQDLHTKLTPSELNGVISVLKLFTTYELRVGNYWMSYVAKFFPRPEVIRMASVFAMTELAIHSPFYSRINDMLGLDTEEFYLSYKEDPILANRMDWLERRVKKHTTIIDKLKSVAVFSMIEGAILFSAFAFLKSFNTNGKNVLGNLNTGIDFTVREELQHSEAGAYLFNTLKAEAYYDKLIDDSDIIKLNYDLRETAKLIFEHESIIVSKIFEQGTIEGITETQLNHFVESRLDICLHNINVGTLFRPSYNPVANWFYLNLNSSTLNDFFVTQGTDYKRNWNESKLSWKIND